MCLQVMQHFNATSLWSINEVVLESSWKFPLTVTIKSKLNCLWIHPQMASIPFSWLVLDLQRIEQCPVKNESTTVTVSNLTVSTKDRVSAICFCLLFVRGGGGSNTNICLRLILLSAQGMAVMEHYYELYSVIRDNWVTETLCWVTDSKRFLGIFYWQR